VTGPSPTGNRRVVVALGGNALLRRGEPLDAEHQRANVRRAARAVAGLVHGGDQVVVTHGNGPQVGLLALQADAYPGARPYPLDVLGAETEGMIGYLLEQCLAAELPGREVVTLLTQVEVDPDDPAFAGPTKPIGPVYPIDEGEALGREHDWAMARDGDGLRRVVPSPSPVRIVELASIVALLDTGAVVLCAGGGGIPVVADPGGEGRRGVEAVIDKDATAALLARELAADVLLVLTDVPAVQIGWGTPGARTVRRAAPHDLRQYDFAAGSMRPKVEAAAAFVVLTGGRAAIGCLDDAAALLAGTAGTQVLRHTSLVLDPPSPPSTRSSPPPPLDEPKDPVGEVPPGAR
jgi:carbamate kinase